MSEFKPPMKGDRARGDLEDACTLLQEARSMLRVCHIACSADHPEKTYEALVVNMEDALGYIADTIDNATGHLHAVQNWVRRHPEAAE